MTRKKLVSLGRASPCVCAPREREGVQFRESVDCRGAWQLKRAHEPRKISIRYHGTCLLAIGLRATAPSTVCLRSSLTLLSKQQPRRFTPAPDRVRAASDALSL